MNLISFHFYTAFNKSLQNCIGLHRKQPGKTNAAGEVIIRGWLDGMSRDQVYKDFVGIGTGVTRYGMGQRVLQSWNKNEGESK